MDEKKFCFEIPLGQIFGASTTASFCHIQKMLGFWQGRKFMKMLELLRQLGIESDWVRFIEIDIHSLIYRRYETEEIQSLPEQPLSDESIIVVFYDNGRIDRFEVIGGRLCLYCHPDNWPSFEWPVGSERITVDYLTFLRTRNSGSTGSLSEVRKIILFKPIEDDSVDLLDDDLTDIEDETS